jgi:hypothetical protein
MVFGELLELVRREGIVDLYEDAFTDAVIYDALWRASVETAAAFDIPREIRSVPVAQGTTSITITPPPRKVHTVIFAGDDMRSADPQELLRYQLDDQGVPQYFNYDPRRAQGLLIAPPPNRSGMALVEVTAGLVRPVEMVLPMTEAWNGVLSEFHSIIMYRAVVALYQQDERQEESGYWVQEYQNRASELAAFLGRTDIPNLIIPAEARDDKGARE